MEDIKVELEGIKRQLEQTNEYLNQILLLLTSGDLRLLAMKLGIWDPIDDPKYYSDLTDAINELANQVSKEQKDQEARHKKAQAEAKSKGNSLKAILATLTIIIILIVILLIFLLLR